ncbi:MAG TPA: hypothetical protein VGG75_24315 [Trebonia sp.]
MSTHDYNSGMGGGIGPKGDVGGSGSLNGGGYHGANTGPNVGQYYQPATTLDYGSNSTSPNTPAAAQSGNDYSQWNYEQTMVTVLGLPTPTRTTVTQGDWIAIADNSSGGSGLYRIFGATWKSGVAGSWVNHKDIFVYVNPGLLTPQGSWDEYFNTPVQAVNAARSGDYSSVNVDPRTLVTAADEVAGVTSFFGNTATSFNSMVYNLGSDDSSFKGQAGQAFYELVRNLWTMASQAYSALGTPTPGYAGQINDAGNAINTFLTAVWNALVSWTSHMTYTPIGAIYQAMVNGQVINEAGSGSAMTFTMKNPGSTSSSFGDLTTQVAWTNIEQAAKELWTQGVASNLDPAIKTAVTNLANSYHSASGSLQKLLPPTLQKISPGNSQNGNPNMNIKIPPININIPPINIGGPNGSPNLNIGGGGGGGNHNINLHTGGPNGGPNLNVGGGGKGGPNSTAHYTSGVGGPGGSNIPGGLNTPGGNTPAFSTDLANPGGLGGPNTSIGGLNGGPSLNTQNALQQAAGDNGDTQDALESALGMMPSGSPLGNALQTALGDSGNTSSALNSALGSGNPSAIQQALADNGDTQAAIKSALAQAPSTGPLHNALETALGDSQNTGQQLQSALQSAQAGPGTSLGSLGGSPGSSLATSLGGPTGTEQTALQHALSDNGQAQGALQTALGLTPSTGPLHSAVQTALGDAGNVTKAVDSALGSGSPSAVQQALTQNSGLESALRSALAKAPATGPLHNALQSALGDANKTGQQLQQSLNNSGAALEPPASMLAGPEGSGTSLGAFHLPAGQQSLSTTLGDTGSGAGGIGGAGGLSTGLGGGAAGPASSGAFVSPGGQAAVLSSGAAGPAGASSGAAGAAGAAGSAASGGSSSGTSAVPFYPPMAGGMGGMGGMGMQQEERERSTWLAEDEDVWGTDPDIGPSVLGRDLMPDDEADGYDDYDERPMRKPRQDPSRLGGR